MNRARASYHRNLFIFMQLTDLTTASADTSLRGSQMHDKHCGIHGGYRVRRVGVSVAVSTLFISSRHSRRAETVLDVAQ
jgi:hypothetical protein